jgi:hypothetical protein
VGFALLFYVMSPLIYDSNFNQKIKCVFFLGGGVRLSPLGMSATNWPIVPAPDDR